MSELPPISDSSAAESSLGYLRYWREKKTEVEAHTEQQIKEALKWNERQLLRINAKIAFHEQRLREYMEHSRIKKLDLINGLARIRPGRKSLKFSDWQSFFRWIEEDGERLDLIKVTHIPEKSEVVKYIKRTGEIPPGVEWEAGPDTLVVRHFTETEEMESEKDDEDQEPCQCSEEGSEPGTEDLEA